VHTARLLQFPSPTCTKEILTLEGARVARSPFNAKYRTVSVCGRQIESVSMPGVADLRRPAGDEVRIDLTGYMVLPGLINAHDHLDFSLFPRLGRGPYPGWREWAADIHRSQQSSIQECLRVSRDTRIQWGGIHNLLSGVTTVSHHNPYLSRVFHSGFPVHVPREYGWAHSLAEIRSLIEQLSQTPPDWPFILHLAEGTNDTSQRELDVLESLLPLSDRLVLVHCVGLTHRQRERVALSGTGVVWCPSSNLFTLGRTLTTDQVSAFPNVALGTDSPLTAGGDLLDEIRLAYATIGLPAPLIYELVTTRAAQLLRLKDGQGSLQAGDRADLIVTRDRQLMPAETLTQLSWRDIELVIQNGRIVLLSPALAGRFPKSLKQGMEWISIDGVDRLLRAPVRELLPETSASLGRAPAICGRDLALVAQPSSATPEFVPMSEFRSAGQPDRPLPS
jgi:cytosine/adenosine deaminase-related metal-dependent hydrolase